MSGVVDGEYDARRSEISVRRTAADGTIAHELVHALQDQNFGLGVPVTDVDTQLARMALIEGDARWTELLVTATTSRSAMSFVPDRPSMMFPEAERYELDDAEKLAERAAAGWGGDAFVLTARPGFYTFTLATVWDSVEDAVEFEDAMRRTAACWDVREPIDGDYDGPTLVRRGGRTVVVIRGNGPAARGAQLPGPDQ